MSLGVEVVDGRVMVAVPRDLDAVVISPERAVELAWELMAAANQAHGLAATTTTAAAAP